MTTGNQLAGIGLGPGIGLGQSTQIQAILQGISNGTVNRSTAFLQLSDIVGADFAGTLLNQLGAALQQTGGGITNDERLVTLREQFEAGTINLRQLAERAGIVLGTVEAGNAFAQSLLTEGQSPFLGPEGVIGPEGFPVTFDQPVPPSPPAGAATLPPLPPPTGGFGFATGGQPADLSQQGQAALGRFLGGLVPGGTAVDVNPADAQFQVGRGPQIDLESQRAMGFQDELPSESFIRFLARAQAGSGGQAFAPRVQRALQSRGSLFTGDPVTGAGGVASLFGAGLPPELGGQSFLDFFEGTGANLPAPEAVGLRLRALGQAVQTPWDMQTLEQQALLSSNPTPEARREALLSSLLLRTSPGVRAGLSNQFRRFFETQQATQPQQAFLPFAIEQGFVT
jgi:hypothetical protein